MTHSSDNDFKRTDLKENRVSVYDVVNSEQSKGFLLLIPTPILAGSGSTGLGYCLLTGNQFPISAMMAPREQCR